MKPVRPMVKTKARASGTPAKLAATPENVMIQGPERHREPARDHGVGEDEAEDPAGIAVTRLISRLAAYAFAVIGLVRLA